MIKFLFDFRSTLARLTFSIPIVFLCFNTNAQECSCSESFEELQNAIEENYSLFKIKVDENNREIYNAFNAVLMEQAKSASDFEECKVILGHWLKFFRDGHVWISYRPPSDFNTETIALGEEKFKDFYLNPTQAHEDLIGIWESDAYRVAIIPEENPESNNRDYVGVILESQNDSWKPDEVKFVLKREYGNDFRATFFMGNHSPRKITSKLQNEGLLKFEGLNDWRKVWPENGGGDIPKTNIPKQSFYFEMLEGEIPYFRFPNFSLSFVDSLENVLEAYHDQLMKAEYMVVDVRQNSGGSDAAYYPLMPYILTGPIQIPNVHYYLSTYNKTKLGVDVEEDKIDDLEDEEAKAIYKLFYNSQDTLINFNQENYFTYSLDTFYVQPKKVAILIGEKTVSSGETFVLRSKASPKVILYGQNTAGIVDGFNGLDLELSCFSVRYPSSVRAFDVPENPIDPYGIAPDVYLDKSVDALDFALKHIQLMKD